MSERENLGAGVYAALSALLVLGCLIGAWVLPPSISLNSWLGLVALIGFFVGIPILLRVAHRSRIHEAVEALGGTVLAIRRRPFWRQPSSNPFFLGERYEVDYEDLLGATHRALCKSGFFQGVVWLDDVVVEVNRETG